MIDIISILDTGFKNLSNFASSQLSTFLGGFLGFGSALVVNTLYTNSRKKNSIKNIATELIIFRNTLGEIVSIIRNTKNESDLRETIECLSHSIYVPIWDTIIQTGDILEFKNEKYFDNLILIYSHISKLSKMTDWYFEHSHELKQADNTHYINKISKQCCLVYDLITFQDDKPYLPDLYQLLQKYN